MDGSELVDLARVYDRWVGVGEVDLASVCGRWVATVGR